jgi:hypothetical protein
MNLRTWSCALAIAICACESLPEVQTVLRPDGQNLEPRERDCPLVVYPIGQRLDPSCKEVGDLWVGDTGSTTECDWDQVLDTVRRHACFAGVDAAQIVNHYEPSFWASTCHQVRARLVVCRSEDGHGQ